VPSNRIDVRTANGVVTLSGRVEELFAKRRAARIAETVKGVRALVDEMTVSAERPNAELRDAVEGALLLDPATDAWEITTAAANGNVTLTRTVQSGAAVEAGNLLDQLDASREEANLRAIEARLEHTITRPDDRRAHRASPRAGGGASWRDQPGRDVVENVDRRDADRRALHELHLPGGHDALTRLDALGHLDRERASFPRSRRWPDGRRAAGAPVARRAVMHQEDRLAPGVCARSTRARGSPRTGAAMRRRARGGRRTRVYTRKMQNARGPSYTRPVSAVAGVRRVMGIVCAPLSCSRSAVGDLASCERRRIMRAPQTESVSDQPRERSSGKSVATFILGGLAFIAVIALVAGMFREDERIATGERALGVDAIAAAPDAYYGRTVTITGDVADVYGPRMFTLDEDTIGAGADLVVLLKNAMPGTLDDAEVTVTGTVRKFTRAELTRDYAWIDDSWFAGRDLSATEKLPVVIAESASIG
jgi:hypothetical protein